MVGEEAEGVLEPPDTEFQAAAHLEPAEQVADVLPYGALGEAAQRSDFLIRQACTDGVKDLRFPGREVHKLIRCLSFHWNGFVSH